MFFSKLGVFIGWKYKRLQKVSFPFKFCSNGLCVQWLSVKRNVMHYKTNKFSFGREQLTHCKREREQLKVKEEKGSQQKRWIYTISDIMNIPLRSRGPKQKTRYSGETLSVFVVLVYDIMYIMVVMHNNCIVVFLLWDITLLNCFMVISSFLLYIYIKFKELHWHNIKYWTELKSI